MVGEAAEYNSVRVNTLRHSQDGSKLPGYQRNLVAVLTTKREFCMKTIFIVVGMLLCGGLLAFLALICVLCIYEAYSFIRSEVVRVSKQWEAEKRENEHRSDSS